MISAFLSSSKRTVKPPVDFMWETCAFSRGATGESDLPSLGSGFSVSH